MNYEEIFDIFKSSYVGKEIRKDIILNRLFNADDKEIIERFVTNIYIKYSVKAENINKKAEKNFEEIQIIEININDYRTIYDIYGILLSIIPYPILAIFRYNDRVSFAVSNRILAEDKNNKGKIYTSYLIKEEEINSYLKIDIVNCQTMIDVYNKWIYNIENVASYYERIDSVINIIEFGFRIKSEKVLEKLEDYIVKYCYSYNMKPKVGWKSKLEKYSDNLLFTKKVEIHSLWEYLSKNTFLKNKLEDFSDWNDFKEACVYNNRFNDIYYSQYDSRMSYDDISYDDESINNTDKYIEKKYVTKRNNEKAVVKEPKSEIRNTNENLLVSHNIIEETKNNKEIMLKLIEEKGCWCLRYASDELKNEKDFILQIIKNFGTVDGSNCVEYISEELKNDKEFMLEAIKYDPWCIQYASDELKNDKEIILQCVKKSNLCIKCASDKLKSDKGFMLQVVDINSEALKYLGDKLKNDKDFMLQAFKKDNSSLEYASDELKANKEFMEDINKIIENSAILEFDYVPNNFFLCRNEKYGIIDLLEECGITVLEKNIFTMKIINKSASWVTECDGAPLYLLNEILEKLDTENAEYFIIDWKLNLSDITKEKLKYFYELMRKRGMVYSIYKSNKEEKNILMEYTDENVTFQSQKSPLYRYINQNFDQNDDIAIIQLCDIQPKIMMGISDLLYLLADKANSEYRDYIAILPHRKTFDDIWYYSMENNIKYIYLLSLIVFEIPENIIKQIDDCLKRNNVEYQIEKEIDDILITMYPTEVEVIDFVINILESNKIVYCDVSCAEALDDIKYAQTSLWMFEVSKKNKEEISSILSQVDQKRIDLLKELGAPEIIVQHHLAPINCNYGIIVNSDLQNFIETILQDLKIKYDILDKDEYIM